MIGFAGLGHMGTPMAGHLLTGGHKVFTAVHNKPAPDALVAQGIVVKATGKEVGAVYMPAPQSGSPMTYMLDGKQYIVVAVSGGAYSGEYIAYSLPSAN